MLKIAKVFLKYADKSKWRERKMKYFHTRTTLESYQLLDDKFRVVYETSSETDKETAKKEMIIAASKLTKKTDCFVINSCIFDSDGKKI